MPKVYRPLFRRKPERRFAASKNPVSDLLLSIDPCDVGEMAQLHQIHASAVAICAAKDWFPKEWVFYAEALAENLSEATRWGKPEGFIDLATRDSFPETHVDVREKRLTPGFCWRMFVVSLYADTWCNAPTLSDFENDVEITQQAALYYPEAIPAVAQRMSEKYDVLWILGEHYMSWRALMPSHRSYWKQYAGEEDGDVAFGFAHEISGKDVPHDLDMLCEHVLYEIALHKSRLEEVTGKQSYRGTRGDVLVAKVIDECWRMWRWVQLPDPFKRGQFKAFYDFVASCLEVMSLASADIGKVTEKTVRRYLKKIREEDDGFGRMGWSEERMLTWSPPGSAVSQYVMGHNKTYYPRRWRYWWPRFVIRARALWNVLRGYPATMNNHNGFLS